MRIDGVELESPLLALRPMLGDARVDEIGEVAFELSQEYSTVEELVVFAEHLRLFATSRARKEAHRVLAA
jgi:hypothetical protein